MPRNPLSVNPVTRYFNSTQKIIFLDPKTQIESQTKTLQKMLCKSMRDTPNQYQQTTWQTQKTYPRAIDWCWEGFVCESKICCITESSVLVWKTAPVIHTQLSVEKNLIQSVNQWACHFFCSDNFTGRAIGNHAVTIVFKKSPRCFCEFYTLTAAGLYIGHYGL